MKKSILIGITVVTCAVQAYSQGTVTFQNPGAAVSNILTLAPVVAGTTFRAALYWLPDQATAPTTADFDARGAQAIGYTVTSFAAAGTIVVASPVRIDGISPAGAPGWFQVRAWETAFGTTYEAARDNPNASGGRRALIGTSNIIRVDTGDPTTTPAGTPGSLTQNGLRGFYVAPVPEPSVIGLGIMGVGALLLLRRRSK